MRNKDEKNMWGEKGEANIRTKWKLFLSFHFTQSRLSLTLIQIFFLIKMKSRFDLFLRPSSFSSFPSFFLLHNFFSLTSLVSFSLSLSWCYCTRLPLCDCELWVTTMKVNFPSSLCPLTICLSSWFTGHWSRK